MQASAALFQFAAEFLTFLVAAAGLALVALRPRLLNETRIGRAGFAFGFLSMGAAAFLRGSRVVGGADEAAVVALRSIGVLLPFVGSLEAGEAKTATRLLWLGLGVEAVATVLGLVNAPNVATEAVLVAGAFGVGGALFLASRRSIAARVAASSALTLLLVVLVLSVALSQVLSSTVRNQAVTRLDSRAKAEAAAVANSFVARLGDALVVSASVRGFGFDEPAADGRNADALARLRGAISSLQANFFPQDSLLWLAPSRQVLAVATPRDEPVLATDPGVSIGIAGSPVVDEALRTSQRVGSVLVERGRMFSVAASPALKLTNGQTTVVGLAIAATPLDRTYLQGHALDDSSLSLAVAGRDGPLAMFGVQPSAANVRQLASSVVSGSSPVATMTANGRFLVARPIKNSAGIPLAAVVASTPTTAVTNTRNSLFGTLFAIALGGTFLALLLAALVGDRIGAGLRRLTTAAEGIQRGEVGVRSGIVSEDEVGVLSAAFDSMVGSLEEQTAALVQAAEDETRLRNRLEAVVGGMGEALVAVDATGHVTDFNAAAEELLGLSAASVRRRPVDEVITLAGEDGSDLGRQLGRPSPRRWSTEGWVGQPDGTRVPVALSSGALRGPAQELSGCVYVLRDLRPEREVERMKTEFLSRVGHELRTPLAGISGYARLLNTREVPRDRARSFHKEILEQSKRLERIVEMLEFFATAGAGRVLLRPEPVDLRSVVSEVAAGATSRIDGSHHVATKVARGMPQVVADRRWVMRALEELVDNALKFSPDGGRVTISAAPADGGREVELSVADRGKGMTADERAQAFGEFVQGDTSDTRQFGGLGLGLSLVQRVAEGHGGKVTCVSERGKGSKFSVLLPVVPMKARDEAGRTSDGTPRGAGAGRRLRPARPAGRRGAPRGPRAG